MPAKKYKRRKAKKLCLMGRSVIESHSFLNIDRTVKSTWVALFIFLICALIRDQVKHGSLFVYISNLCLDQGSSKGWFALYIFLICALFRDQVKVGSLCIYF